MTPQKTQMALKRLGSRYGNRSQIEPGWKMVGNASTGLASAPPIIGPMIDLLLSIPVLEVTTFAVLQNLPETPNKRHDCIRTR